MNLDWQVHTALNELVTDYGRILDENRSDDLLSIFTKNCEARYLASDDDVLRGNNAVVEWMKQALAPLGATCHVFSNFRSTMTGTDTAEGSVYLYAWHRLVETGATFEVWGRYDDSFVNQDGAWRIYRRRLLVYGDRGTPAGITWAYVPRA